MWSFLIINLHFHPLTCYANSHYHHPLSSHFLHCVNKQLNSTLNSNRTENMSFRHEHTTSSSMHSFFFFLFNKSLSGFVCCFRVYSSSSQAVWSEELRPPRPLQAQHDPVASHFPNVCALWARQAQTPSCSSLPLQIYTRRSQRRTRKSCLQWHKWLWAHLEGERADIHICGKEKGKWWAISTITTIISGHGDMSLN